MMEESVVPVINSCMLNISMHSWLLHCIIHAYSLKVTALATGLMTSNDTEGSGNLSSVGAATAGDNNDSDGGGDCDSSSSHTRDELKLLRLPWMIVEADEDIKCNRDGEPSPPSKRSACTVCMATNNMLIRGVVVSCACVDNACMYVTCPHHAAIFSCIKRAFLAVCPRLLLTRLVSSSHDYIP